MNIREDLMKELTAETNRVQYDGNDEARIISSTNVYTEATVGLIEALGKYVEAMKAEVDENSADAMKAARYDIVYAWAGAQAAISNLAYVLRIDGDTAYKLCVEATLRNEDPDLSHL